VTVYSSGGIDIQGVLSATGTVSQPITFTALSANSGQANQWNGITVEGRATLAYVTIANAATALGLSGATGSFDHLTLMDSARGFSAGGGATVTTLTNSTFTDNTGDAAQLFDSPTNLGSFANNSFAGNGFDGVALYGGYVTRSETWPATTGQIKLAGSGDSGSVGVAVGAALTIAPGVNFYAVPSAVNFDVQGTLYAVGTASQPILFQSDPYPGKWNGITVEGGAAFSHVSILDANTALSVNDAPVSIHDSTIINDNFGIANCATPSCPIVHAENNDWGTPSGPAPLGTGPGVSYHLVTIGNSTVEVLDVSVQPWVGETFQQYNGPADSSDGGSDGSSTDGGWYSGSANNDMASTGEPVNTGTGSYEYSHTDLTLAGRMPLIFARSYNSRTAAVSPGPLGYGWTFTYGISLTTPDNGSTIHVTFGTGRADIFHRQTDGSYVAASRQFDTLAANRDGAYDVRDKKQYDYHFSQGGALQSITDRSGNVTTLTYSGSGHLASVSAAGSRSLAFSYNGGGQISAVTDNSGRTVLFGYSSAGDLTTAIDPRGNSLTYAYDGGHQFTSGVDRNGHTFVTNSYDNTDAGRVISQVSARGDVTTFNYYNNGSNGVTVVTDPRGARTTYTYDNQMRLISLQNALGGLTTYTYDAQGDRLTATDPNNHKWTYSYDSRGNMLTKTDSLNNVSTWSYDTGNKPLSMVDPMGQVTSYTYDAHENLRTQTDPLGNTATYTYTV